MPSLQTKISAQSSASNPLTSHQQLLLSSQSCCLKTKLGLQDKRFQNKAKTHYKRNLFIPRILLGNRHHRKVSFSSHIYTTTRSWCWSLRSLLSSHLCRSDLTSGQHQLTEESLTGPFLPVMHTTVSLWCSQWQKACLSCTRSWVQPQHHERGRPPPLSSRQPTSKLPDSL